MSSLLPSRGMFINNKTLQTKYRLDWVTHKNRNDYDKDNYDKGGDNEDDNEI